MLDKELDKLRDKTLSFGCVIFEKSWWDVNYHRITTAKKQDNWEYTCECWWYEIFDISEYNIIWNQLNRWRICYLYHESDNWYNQNKDHTINSIQDILINNYIMLNQSELERMQYEKRPELRELLIQFSNYL